MLEILGSFQKNKTKKSLKEDNPELCKEWNYEKNGAYSPNRVSYSSNLIVWWKCSKCGHERKNPDFAVTNIDLKTGEIIINDKYSIHLSLIK